MTLVKNQSEAYEGLKGRLASKASKEGNVARWKIVCTWWANTTLILQNPLAYCDRNFHPWYSKSLSVFPPWLSQARIACLVVNYLGWKTSLASNKHPALNSGERISKDSWLTDTALIQTIKDHYNFHKIRNLLHTLWVCGKFSSKSRCHPWVTLLEVEWKETSVHHYNLLVSYIGS